MKHCNHVHSKHDFGKWQICAREQLQRTKNRGDGKEKENIGNYIVQERSCDRCGYTEHEARLIDIDNKTNRTL